MLVSPGLTWSKAYTDIASEHAGALQRWRQERAKLSHQAALVSATAVARACERVVVFSKRDLVPQWGIEVRHFVYDTPPPPHRPRVHVQCPERSDTGASFCLQPFRRAMTAKFPDQRTFFASWNNPRDIKALSALLVSMSKFTFLTWRHLTPEL